MEDKIAHLGFIQSIINRMATNSFLIKGWCITLVAAMFALSSKDSNIQFVILVLFPTIAFWLLDTYFFYQEKLFRWLYEEVAVGKISSEIFTLKTEFIKYDEKIKLIKDAIFLPQTIVFYLLIISVIIYLS